VGMFVVHVPGGLLIGFPDRWSAIGSRSKCLFISYGLEDLFICHWIHNSRINRIKFKQSLTEISHTKAHTICSSISLKKVGLRCWDLRPIKQLQIHLLSSHNY